jgi:hypothetical protein
MWFPSKYCVVLIWWISRLFGWKWISYRTGQVGSRQRFCVHLCLAGPSLPRCLQQLSFWGSLCCTITGKVTDTLRWREICVGGWQLQVLCLYLLWWVQVLPDVCRCLQFFVLCFTFTDPSGRELRMRKRKEKEKSGRLSKAIWPCSQPFPASE